MFSKNMLLILSCLRIFFGDYKRAQVEESNFALTTANSFLL